MSKLGPPHASSIRDVKVHQRHQCISVITMPSATLKLVLASLCAAHAYVLPGVMPTKASMTMRMSDSCVEVGRSSLGKAQHIAPHTTFAHTPPDVMFPSSFSRRTHRVRKRTHEIAS